MAKQKTSKRVQLTLNTNNQRLFVALSLWVRVKVTHGKKHRNFNEMMKEQLTGIINREVCDPQSDDSAEPEELINTKQYVPW